MFLKLEKLSFKKFQELVAFIRSDENFIEVFQSSLKPDWISDSRKGTSGIYLTSKKIPLVKIVKFENDDTSSLTMKVQLVIEENIKTCFVNYNHKSWHDLRFKKERGKFIIEKTFGYDIPAEGLCDEVEIKLPLKLVSKIFSLLGDFVESDDLFNKFKGHVVLFPNKKC